MTRSQRLFKRLFDLTVSAIGLALCWWLIFIAVVVATIDTRAFGLFMQVRVGRNASLFKVLKIRTMRVSTHGTTVTTVRDERITRVGLVLRRWKIDELPQLVNVFLGQMSFVGPRPDVPGFADKLEGLDRRILSIRPGITGPATLYFRNEEQLLSECDDPDVYNRDIVFPAKVKINLLYLEKYSLREDLRIIWATVIGKSYTDLYGEMNLDCV